MDKFKILQGLPPYGNPAVTFSMTGMRKHAEGLVVEFYPSNAPSWIGNFVRGGMNFDYVLEHLHSQWIIVIAGGDAYIVDFNNQQLVEKAGGMIIGVLNIPENSLLILNNNINLIAYNEHGKLWQTPRISWDGIQNLKAENNFITGESWSPIENKHFPFKASILTGECSGGSYDESQFKLK